MPPILVFSDMDGTLLDHFDYSFAAAEPALKRLRAAGIPLILNTSKTFAELQVWRQRLGSAACFIVENGAAAYFANDELHKSRMPYDGAKLASLKDGASAEYSILEMSMDRPEILEIVNGLRREAGFLFRGFSDFSVQELCEITGLTSFDAENALKRGFSEPICWDDTEARWVEFAECVNARGLQCLRGGRFIHIMGQTDKGRAMKAVAALLSPKVGPICVALGDSGNDIAMLQQADYAVVIRSPVHPPLDVPDARGQLMLSDAEGPAGWNDSMMTILDELDV